MHPEMLIRDRTCHRSHVLFKYEKISVTSAEVSEVMVTNCSTSNEEMTKDTEGTVEIGNSKSSCDQFMVSANFLKNCKININVNK